MDAEKSLLSTETPILFAHTSASEVFPTLIWLADLAPESYEPLNRTIAAKLDAMTQEGLSPHISKVFSLDEAKDALEFIATRQSTGKVLICP